MWRAKTESRNVKEQKKTKTKQKNTPDSFLGLKMRICAGKRGHTVTLHYLEPFTASLMSLVIEGFQVGNVWQMFFTVVPLYIQKLISAKVKKASTFNLWECRYRFCARAHAHAQTTMSIYRGSPYNSPWHYCTSVVCKHTRAKPTTVRVSIASLKGPALCWNDWPNNWTCEQSYACYSQWYHDNMEQSQGIHFSNSPSVYITD